MSAARWIQCEEITSAKGMIAAHPTTKAPIASPYINIGLNYMNQMNRLWAEIYDIIRTNSLQDVRGTNPQDDVMERLLSARRGK